MRVLSGFLIGVLFLCATQVFAEGTDLDIGRDIFFKHCKACHGIKGDGKTFAANVLNPPPKNFISNKRNIARSWTRDLVTRTPLAKRRYPSSIKLRGLRHWHGTRKWPWVPLINLTSRYLCANMQFLRKIGISEPQGSKNPQIMRPRLQ